MLFEDLNIPLLPTHAVPSQMFQSSQSESLLQYHFQRCLRVHFCGGDIKDEYPPGTIIDFLKDVGLWDAPITSLGDPRFTETNLGRAVFQTYLGNHEVSEKKIKES
jgi:hypothetical protein